jgi:hypothetical protein
MEHRRRTDFPKIREICMALNLNMFSETINRLFKFSFIPLSSGPCYMLVYLAFFFFLSVEICFTSLLK